MNNSDSDLQSERETAVMMGKHDHSNPTRIDGPPPLPLNLHEHKLSIFINWGVIILTACIAPLVLYPSLHWGANLSDKIGAF